MQENTVAVTLGAMLVRPERMRRNGLRVGAGGHNGAQRSVDPHLSFFSTRSMSFSPMCRSALSDIDTLVGEGPVREM